MATNFLAQLFPNELGVYQNSPYVTSQDGFVEVLVDKIPFPALRQYVKEFADSVGVDLVAAEHAFCFTKKGQTVMTPTLRSNGEAVVLSFGKVNKVLDLPAMYKAGWQFAETDKTWVLSNSQYEFSNEAHFAIIPVSWAYDDEKKCSKMPNGLNPKTIKALFEKPGIHDVLRRISSRPQKLSALPTDTNTFFVTEVQPYSGYQGSQEYSLRITTANGKSAYYQASGQSKKRLANCTNHGVTPASPAVLTVTGREERNWQTERGTGTYTQVSHTFVLPTDPDIESLFIELGELEEAGQF